MGERTDQIERDLETTRGQLSDNLVELKQRARSAVDWRAQAQEHPGAMLAAAFGGGVILSALFNGLRGPRAVYRQKGRRGSADRARVSSEADTAPKARRSTAPAKLGVLSDALIGLAIGQATHFIEGMLPGFNGEVRRARNSREESET
jgi:hypothetical protein